MRDLFGSREVFVALGKIAKPPTPGALSPQGARLVYVDLLSSQDDCTVHARVLNLGQGLGKGLFMPLTVGDEVLVLFPHGDLNQGVVIGGLGNGAAVNPVGNLGTSALVQHPGGVKLTTTDGQPLHGIVHGQFLVDLADYITKFETLIKAIATSATAADIAAKAAAFMTAVGMTPATPSLFAANMTASAGSGTPPGAGGAPYATALHKVSP